MKINYHFLMMKNKINFKPPRKPVQARKDEIYKTMLCFLACLKSAARRQNERGEKMDAYMFRQQIAQLVDEWPVYHGQKRTFQQLSEMSGVHNTVIKNMHNEHGASLESICKVLEVLGYELIIQKKEW